jgi:chromosome segregation ATPase
LWDWLAWLGSAKDIEHKALRDERDSLRTDLKEIMHAYQRLNQDLQQQIEVLREEVEALADDLRKERKAHADCQVKLKQHEDEIYTLKVQVRELMRDRDNG